MPSRRNVEPRSRLSVENLNRIGIPKEFHKIFLVDLEDIQEVTKNMETYIRYIHNNFEDGVGLFLYGSNGVGKSAIASILLREAYRHRYTAKRTTMNLLTPVGIKSKWDEDVNADYHQYYLNVEFLAIEEIGKEQEGEKKANINVLEEVLRHRCENNLPTFLISNLPVKEFRERYGESIWSLVNQMTVPIKIVGEDKRQSKKSREILNKFRSER